VATLLVFATRVVVMVVDAILVLLGRGMAGLSRRVSPQTGNSNSFLRRQTKVVWTVESLQAIATLVMMIVRVAIIRESVLIPTGSVKARAHL
jgi:hypothetical protein